ncbi:MAG: single-stranded-DNA-specific exonuclease RecJ [Chloroflexota bacterium]|nr:single-stranded-DNA-specific exonuclease RecJ [Chloroflexota bacterium]
MSPQKRWRVASPAPPEHLRRYVGMSPALAQVLYNRGFTDPDDARRFLDADDLGAGRFLALSTKSNTPIMRALTRIRQAITRKERIIIYGDFDADGVTSTALLLLTLRYLGAHVDHYIPHRVDEGYGLNSEALRKLAAAGCKLVITVDCGVRSMQEVEDGTAAGLDIIVTDHHTPGSLTPNAYAVINPKLTDFPYTEDMLAGVGVAFRIAEALLTIHNGMGRNGGTGLTVDDLLDLVAIGTVADLAPLNRLENRALVKRGLARMQAAPRMGLVKLLEVAGLKTLDVDSDRIGYVIGPRINAAGRLASAETALKLFISADENEALELANELQGLNLRRQELTHQAQELVRVRLIESGLEEADLPPLIFASDRSFLPGIVGLVAGRLTESYFRPAIVLEEGEHESRASCRSIPEFDITHALDQCADLLVRHGGHAQAAGFTVVNENIQLLRDKLTNLAREALRGQPLQPVLEIDAELDVHQISLDLIHEFDALEPTGHGNPKPTLATRGARVLDWRFVGKEQKHVKLRLARAGQPPLDAIGFNMAELTGQLGEWVDVAYALEINEWNGAQSPQLRLLDLHTASARPR